MLEGLTIIMSQCSPVWKTGTISGNQSCKRLLMTCLNVVRSGRPEQLLHSIWLKLTKKHVSM